MFSAVEFVLALPRAGQSPMAAVVDGMKVSPRRGDERRGGRKVARAAEEPDGCDKSLCGGEAGDLRVAPARFSNLRVSASPRAKMLLRPGNSVICDGPANVRHGDCRRRPLLTYDPDEPAGRSNR